MTDPSSKLLLQLPGKGLTTAYFLLMRNPWMMKRKETDRYLQAILSTYHASSKTKKGELLTYSEFITKRPRKSLIRRLRELSAPPPNGDVGIKRVGRPASYSKSELMPHIGYLWNQMERLSAKRMKAALPDWLPRYKACPAHLRTQIEKMSASTLDRYLRELRASLVTSKGLSTTNPAEFMKNKVPINTLDSKITKPGYTQADTVSHCGSNASGPFISSLTVTDIFTTWTENRAMFTKKGKGVKRYFKEIEKGLPFKLRSINSDSGSEFLNKNMLEFTGYGRRVAFTRSRPYKKNDNCYVEQKNFTHVRELFGYERFDEELLVGLMNEIYTEYWNPLQNFFLPTFKLKEKLRIGSRIKKTYDKPKTPYQRVMESEAVNKGEKETLRQRKTQLDPFELKAGLEDKLKEFFEIVRQVKIREAA